MVPLILLGLLVFVGIAVIAGIVSVVRNPKDALRYYSSKRSLVVLPLTFVGYMAAWIIIHQLLFETHAPLWALLIGGIPLVGILSIGVWVARRTPPAS